VLCFAVAAKQVPRACRQYKVMQVKVDVTADRRILSNGNSFPSADLAMRWVPIQVFQEEGGVDKV